MPGDAAVQLRGSREAASPGMLPCRAQRHPALLSQALAPENCGPNPGSWVYTGPQRSHGDLGATGRTVRGPVGSRPARQSGRAWTAVTSSSGHVEAWIGSSVCSWLSKVGK